jgi:phosphocarrier protein HPr
MVEGEVRVINALGLHARAAAQLVRLANQFSSEITLKREDTGVDADAKSILSVLYIAAACGATIKLTCAGDDEGDAWNAVRDLFTGGFGEQ